jgi:hypothetical protein
MGRHDGSNQIEIFAAAPRAGFSSPRGLARRLLARQLLPEATSTMASANACGAS